MNIVIFGAGGKAGRQAIAEARRPLLVPPHCVDES